MTSSPLYTYSLTYTEIIRALQLVALGLAATVALPFIAVSSGLPTWTFYPSMVFGLAGTFGLGVWASLPVQVLLSLKGVQLIAARRYAPYRLPSGWVAWDKVAELRAAEIDEGYCIVVTAGQHSYCLSGNEATAKECFAAAERYWLESRARRSGAASS